MRFTAPFSLPFADVCVKLQARGDFCEELGACTVQAPWRGVSLPWLRRYGHLLRRRFCHCRPSCEWMSIFLWLLESWLEMERVDWTYVRFEGFRIYAKVYLNSFLRSLPTSLLSVYIQLGSLVQTTLFQAIFLLHRSSCLYRVPPI